jgi:hypothetical protein
MGRYQCKENDGICINIINKENNGICSIRSVNDFNRSGFNTHASDRCHVYQFGKTQSILNTNIIYVTN